MLVVTLLVSRRALLVVLHIQAQYTCQPILISNQSPGNADKDTQTVLSTMKICQYNPRSPTNPHRIESRSSRCKGDGYLSLCLKAYDSVIVNGIGLRNSGTQHRHHNCRHHSVAVLHCLRFIANGILIPSGLRSRGGPNPPYHRGA